MPNPYFALLFVCLFVGSLYGADRFGYRRGSNAVKAEWNVAKDAAATALGEQLVAATSEMAVAEARARAAAKRGASYAASLASDLERIRNDAKIPDTCWTNDNRLLMRAAVLTINSYSKSPVAVELRGKLPGVTVTGLKPK